MKRLVIAFTCALALGLGAAQAKAPPKGPGKPQQGKSQQGKPPQGKPQQARPQQARPPQGKPKQGGSAIGRPMGQPNRFEVSRGGHGGRGMQGSHHRMGMQGAGHHSRHHDHSGFHAGRPDGAMYWDRPGVPPHMAGALRDWYWVATPWAYTVDGVYYYGEGYYFDGYNYCYNGGYHLVPPPVSAVATPVVTQPVVTQPVVTPVAPPPPPPPKRGGGLLNLLFGL